MKYILFLINSSYKDSVYGDIYKDEDVLLYKELKNPVLNKIRNIHLSIKANKYFNLPFKSIWNHTLFDESKLSPDEECIFIFNEGAKHSYNKKYLQYIKKKYKKSKVCFMCLNPSVGINSKYIDFINNEYDIVVSFDKRDSEKYGWKYYSGIYSNMSKENEKEDLRYDIFFVGNNKGRLNILHFLYKKFTDYNLKCNFYISEVNESMIRYRDINYNTYIDYNNVIENIKKSKVILEVLQEGQNGTTLREMEALVYEKGLLTNNQELVCERYYSKDQMYIFDDIENIDMDKVIELCNACSKYKYNGSVSPTLFLKFLNEQYYK